LLKDITRDPELKSNNHLTLKFQ